MANPTPNMGLPVSTVGSTTGLDWETNLNSALSIIDQHNHSPGQGVPISASALDINADLTFNNNNILNPKSVRFYPQTSALAGADDLGCLYESGVDLYYNDGSGNQIRITQSGSVTGATGTITGLPSGTASAAYAAGTFIWQSVTNTSAVMDAGSIILRNNLANSKGLTLNPPNAMGSDYSLTLPSLPATQKFMTLDSSGNMGAPWAVDNSSLEISGSTTLQVKAGGITQAMLAPRTTGTTVGAGGVAISDGSGTFTSTSTSMTSVTNLAVTITTTGRPVNLALQWDTGAGSNSMLFQSVNDNVSYYQVARTGTTSGTVGFTRIEDLSNAYPGTGPIFLGIDPVAAGTYTYTFQVQLGLAGTWRVFFASLVAYEI